MQTSALDRILFVLIPSQIQFACVLFVKVSRPRVETVHDWQALVLENMAADSEKEMTTKKRRGEGANNYGHGTRSKEMEDDGRATKADGKIRNG